MQSLSVVVPNNHCVNKCKFCVSRMHCDDYANFMSGPLLNDEAIIKYYRLLVRAVNNGCKTLLFTGTSEPQQNLLFLRRVGALCNVMVNTFEHIEMQTTGVFIGNKLIDFFRDTVGIDTISLSVSALDDSINEDYIGAAAHIDIHELSNQILDAGITLRMSINLTDYFDRFAKSPETLFNLLQDKYNPHQITFRVLYEDGSASPQAEWVRQHAAKDSTVLKIADYIKENGELIGTLSYGANQYDLNGISVVVDNDCMAKNESKDHKYWILRPDCHIYTQWDDPSSIII